ncbi:MAG: GerMN domain-containing protein [Lachnospiraceae bacterium]|nr:GerMN domain-containing protein [Lachnospiraceae bacterium]
MKKRPFYITFFLCVLVLAVVCFTGCSEEEVQGTSVDISYLNKNETKLVKETHYLQGDDIKENIVEVLTLLCTVPENKELRATLTSGINIVTYTLEDDQVTVSLSEKYKDIPRTTEVLTRAAIVRSLTALDGVSCVMITINGEPLTDTSGNVVGIMTADMFVDNAGEMVEAQDTKVMLRLYFANEEGDGLIAVNRELSHNADVSNVSMEKIVLEQLIKGPANEETYPVISPDTKIVSVTVKDGICHINFDSAFETAINNVTTDVTIYSIVNSLSELSTVNKVQISIDGDSDNKFRDKYDFSTVFERNLSLVN